MIITAAEKVKSFFTQFNSRMYKKGETLIPADENPPGVFYLTSGTVREYAISKKGEEVVVNIFKPASFFPMSWAINNGPNPYFFEALTDTEVYKAPVERVLEFVKKEPDILYDLLSRTFRGTDGLLTRLTLLMTGNAYDRLIIEIVIYSKRFGEINRKTGAVTSAVTEKDLASYTGMTRETVSREIRNLKQKSLIEFSAGKLLVLSIPRLEEELVLHHSYQP